MLFNDSPTKSTTECLEEPLALPAIATTMGPKTVADFTVEAGKLVAHNTSDVFITGTMVGKDWEWQRRGIDITNKAGGVGAPEPRRERAEHRPLKSEGTYLACAMVLEWLDVPAGVDGAIDARCRNTTVAIEAAIKAAGLHDAFNYMGGVAGFPYAYTGYGAANKQRLLDLWRKHDGERVPQTLWLGGLKIGA
ncbi:hypothetical protein MAPG_12048 [Magnaporthiopsis poae ATCC 64411]|uniref:Uncharacterized protein n=1 Tax=Magnaporthiopsis poae (strain ATCC 64411 / 73-15) TaxID=644358 RepID=A0A0C4EGQ8_MAGP6|nr:hypothetical protein MAPG_12048 [Magnaporthiopsis poae ATCC 64411]